MITIGITTYNRKSILEKMARSLYGSDLSYDYSIRIYDDASTEYDEQYLKELFPDAKSIHIHERNLGADGNMRYMYSDFLESDDYYFFNADSDLVFHKGWMNVMMNLIEHTDGVLSAFNVNNPKRHKPGETHLIKGVELVEKETVGAAGTMFSRGIIEDIVNGLSDYDSSAFDWKWSSLLRNKGKKIYTLKKSMVQHIGFTGFNSVSGNFDYGISFEVDSIENGQAINDVVAEISSSTINNARRRISLFPFTNVEKGSRVIIYGAGRYGMDYYRQVKSIDYCTIVALCDVNYDKMEGVTDPQNIKEMEYDYIVISVQRDDLSKEIRKTLCSLEVPSNKILDGSGERLVELT